VNLITVTHHQIGQLPVLHTARWVRDCRRAKLPNSRKVNVKVAVKLVEKVFKNIPDGKTSVGKPRKRQLNDDENDLKEMSVREKQLGIQTPGNSS
jgi:hypothetical protein